MLIALDTATPTLSIALHDGHTLIAEQTWRAGNRHNTLLASSIHDLLSECNLTPRDLTAIAVATGPGSYTGLRIGVALAKGMAATADLPLIGVTTLDILAVGQPFQNTRYKLIAVVEAGRGRIIAGTYHVRKGRWEGADDPRITTWGDLLSQLEGSFYLTGEVDEEGRQNIQALRDAPPEDRELSITVMSAAHRARRAGYLAEEALRRLRDGKPNDFDPAHTLPIYMKSPA